MPILSPEQKAALATELAKPAYSGLADQQAADALNVPPSVPGPARPVTLTVSGLLALLSPASQANLKALPYLPTVRDDINNQDRAAVALWAGFFAQNGVITADEAQAIEGALAATEAGPSTFGPTPFQALFPGVSFDMPDGSNVQGTATAEMVAEGRA
jgi:hypothetical protein